MKLFKNFTFLLLLLTTLNAQTLEPRLYANAPVDLNFMVIAYKYSTGALETSPELQLEDSDLDVDLTAFAYARVFSFFDKCAKFDLIIPTSHIKGTVTQDGIKLPRDIAGLGDIKARISVNIFGSPALSLSEFSNYNPDTIIGLSLQTTVPTGQYNESKLINIGTNTWAIKSGIGISKYIDNFVFELSADAEFYSKNNDYLTEDLQRDPVYSLQAHMIYNMPKGMWFAIGGNYYWGGEAVISNESQDNAFSSTRLSALLAIPIDKRNSIKIHGSTGVNTRIGTDFTSILFAWQYRWSDGL